MRIGQKDYYYIGQIWTFYYIIMCVVGSASLLATKHSQPYSRTMGWLRCRINFSLLHSATTCLRGARSTPRHPVSPTQILDTNLDLVISEAMVPTY